MTKKQTLSTDDVEVTLEILGEKEQGKENANKFAIRVCRAIADATEEGWNELPPVVQEWYNDCADSLNEDSPDKVPAFGPDDGKEGSSNDSDDDNPEEVACDVKELKVGDIAVLVLKKNGEEIEGKVEKMLTNRITIDGEKYTFASVDEAFRIVDLDAEEPEKDEPVGEGEPVEREIDPKEVEEGDQVVLVMKDETEVEGEVVNKTARAVVLVDAKGETRISFAKVDTAFIIEDGAPEKEEEEPEPEKEEEKPKRGKRGAKKGGGIGSKIRAMLVEDPSMSADDVMDALEEAGEDFKEATVKLTVSGFQEIYQALEAAGKLGSSQVEEEEPKEEKPARRGRRTAAKKEPEEKAAPARRGRRGAKTEEPKEEKPARRGRRTAAKKEEEKPASSRRSSGRTSRRRS